MGSKRSKKSKQDSEMCPEKVNNKRKKDKEDEQIEPDVNDSEIENSVVENNVDNIVAPKAAKRKKKAEITGDAPKTAKKTQQLNGIEPKKRVRKKKVKPQESRNNVNATVNPNEVVKENGESVLANPTNNELKLEVAEEFSAKDAAVTSSDKKKEEITWPEQDLTELLRRMENDIPEKDALAYSTRAEKLNWDNIAFSNYTAEDCKRMWMLVQKRIRRFRLLSEVLNDAKEWVRNPKIVHRTAGRARKHPDMPRRPLSSYLLFYLQKKDKILSENPGLDGSDITKLIGQIYKNLPPEKREKYEKMAATNKEEYLEKLKVFFENHPELEPPPKIGSKPDKPVKIEKAVKVDKPVKSEKPVKLDKLAKVEKPTTVVEEKSAKVEKPSKVKRERSSKGDRPPRKLSKSSKTPKLPKLIKDKPPKRHMTPFGLYFASEFKNVGDVEKSAFKEKCKDQWKVMPDKDKMNWINLAELDQLRYQDEIKKYKSTHPEFKVQPVKSILTREDKMIKERASGKPIKPPNSAYGLFSKIMLQSDEIKVIHPKDRMVWISDKWKGLTDDDRNLYQEQCDGQMEKYKEEFHAYLQTLPRHEREKLLPRKKPTRKRKSKSGRRSSRSRTSKKRKVVKKENIQEQIKFEEPEQPPISACKYYVSLYTGDGDPTQIWKTLSVEEKRKYEEELTAKKQAYIIEFEKFLKSLTKEELEAFSRSRQQAKTEEPEEFEEESSECSSGSEDDDEEGEGDDENDDDGHGSETD